MVLKLRIFSPANLSPSKYMWLVVWCTMIFILFYINSQLLFEWSLNLCSLTLADFVYDTASVFQNQFDFQLISDARYHRSHSWKIISFMLRNMKVYG